jgi:hypothetical protein
MTKSESKLLIARLSKNLICPLFAPYLPLICPLFAPYLPLICPLFAPYLPLICPLFAPYLSLICPLFAPKGAATKIPKIDLFDEKITELENKKAEIAGKKAVHDIGWLRINVQPLKERLGIIQIPQF